MSREVVDAAGRPGRRSAELVLAEHRRLQREQVIESLWPHLAPEAGAANLREAAHQARQVLGREDAVVLAQGRVTLLPGAVVDVERFHRLVDVAVRTRDPPDAARAAACTGDLLPDARYEEWTQAPRDRVGSRHVEVLRLPGQWRRLAEVEPVDEQAHRELMRAELRDGNRHAAIRWYGRLRTSRERELGLAPGQRSRALYEECVADLGPAATVYVGRQVELARATVVPRGTGSGARAVRGPAGIGKSTFCGEVSALAARAGRLVVRVTASPGGGPYRPLIEAVEDVFGRHRSQPAPALRRPAPPGRPRLRRRVRRGGRAARYGPRPHLRGDAAR